ncbi:MAG: HK97 family phage prohead protease, partial [Aeromicrobium sp.]
MTDEQTVDDATFQVATSAIPASEVEVRSVEAREIGALIVPWDEVVDTPIGLESFQRGAFAHIDAQNVVLRLGHEGPPVGKGISIEERADGPHMVFRVSKTQRGDEALELARDGVTRHVSIEYAPRTSQSTVENRGGKRVTRVTKADLRGVATTYLPYYDRAA